VFQSVSIAFGIIPIKMDIEWADLFARAEGKAMEPHSEQSVEIAQTKEAQKLSNQALARWLKQPMCALHAKEDFTQYFSRPICQKKNPPKAIAVKKKRRLQNQPQQNELQVLKIDNFLPSDVAEGALLAFQRASTSVRHNQFSI
jgi:hypothetical protein